jgi:hypothetical protein
MQQDPEPTNEQPGEEPTPPVSEQEEEIGDFINRHVLEKDSVFFEG